MFRSSIFGRQSILKVLGERGLLSKTTSVELENVVKEPTTVYLGVDPTAKSMHVGNLVSLLSLLHFYLKGHSVIALVGGATGSIGDPSGKKTERQILSSEQLRENIAGISQQLNQFFDYGTLLAKKHGLNIDLKEDQLRILNNEEWFKDMSILDFLKNVGRVSRINTMLSRER
jgi:tyrosyl-tRNA synthetase